MNNYTKYFWYLNIKDSGMCTQQVPSSFITEKKPPSEIKDVIEDVLRRIYEKAKTVEDLNKTSGPESWDGQDKDNIMYGYEIYLNTGLQKVIMELNPHVKVNVRAARDGQGAEISIDLAIDNKYIENATIFIDSEQKEQFLTGRDG